MISEKTALSADVPRPAGSGDRTDLFTLVFGIWLVAGQYVDGWAHLNLPGTLETFFTPWHGLFYSGFAATAGWIAWRSWVRGTIRFAPPAGYGLGLAGIGVFLAGAATDVAWHLAWGVELEIDALMSPPHVAIIAGMLLMVTSPFRAAWRREGEPRDLRDFAPALGSLILALAVIGFMFLYLSPFVAPDMAAAPAGHIARDFSGEQQEFVRYQFWRAGIASVLLTNALLFAPVLLVMARWRRPPGAFTLLIGSTGAIMTGLYGFLAWPLAVAAVAGGMAADALADRIRSPGLFGLLAPAALWSIYVLVIAVTMGIGWPAELWAGAIAWAALEGWGLSAIVVGVRTRTA